MPATPIDSVFGDSFLRHANTIESSHSRYAKLAIDSCHRINVTRAPAIPFIVLIRAKIIFGQCNFVLAQLVRIVQIVPMPSPI